MTGVGESVKGQIVKIDSLKLWDKNPRSISEKDFERLKKQIQKLGQYKPLLVNQDNIVLGGNMRLRALQDLGVNDVWVNQVKTKDEAEMIEYALSDNDRAGEYDEQQLAELATLHPIDLELYHVDLGKATPLPDLVDKYGPEAEEGEPPEVDESNVVSKLGEVYQLGKHRVMCGDSTKKEDVDRLMGDVKAKLMNTDPPYGIDFVANSQSKGQSAGYDEIENDEVDGEKLQAFLEESIRVAVPHLIDNVPFYLWHPMLTQGTFFAAAVAADIIINRQIIWVKPSLVFGRGDYHWKHELCFYGWRKGHQPDFYGERNQTTVWEIGRENDKVHPTQKPIELFVIPIKNHTKKGDVIYEPFGGSGSQFIAAEQTGRICYGMEIDPKYVDVIRKRYAKFIDKEEEWEQVTPLADLQS